ncbi:Histone acetyltransferase type B catalytic subunit [Gossypium arboreum]|uniref:Histone acetyltransferase type B catalytic subunit n=1 Tax=Gossypium arboreum TaxID=29729 RepID=A0A0B0MDB3_GOSAR|nr:Histone acetyltransferase type B catalytic subunit [Gossypium arboreum]
MLESGRRRRLGRLAFFSRRKMLGGRIWGQWMYSRRVHPRLGHRETARMKRKTAWFHLEQVEGWLLWVP